MEHMENAMNHILLDKQDEAVKRFFLSLPADAQGSVVELNGRAVACVVPVSAPEENVSGRKPEMNAGATSSRKRLPAR
jgi:hypothetical protein